MRHLCHIEKFTFHWIDICLIFQLLRIQTASWKSQNSDWSLKVNGSLCDFFSLLLLVFFFFPNNAILSLASEGISDKWISRMIVNTYIFSIWFGFNPCFSHSENKRFCYLIISKHYSFLFLELFSKYLSKYLSNIWISILAFFLKSFIWQIFFWFCQKELKSYFANPDSLVAIRWCYDC